MPGLIGKKVGMTSIFTEEGKNVACTVIEAGPCVVSQVKTQEKDGYDAIQLAFDDKKEKNTTKPMVGHFNKANSAPKRKVAEFPAIRPDLKLGDVVSVDTFTNDTFLDITGFTKGRGFQGVVKRHGFGGVGDQTHGQHDRSRAPGSLGGSSFPAKVFKGMRMAGRMGNKQVKVMNMRIIKLIPEHNLLLIKGAVPGPNGSYLIITK